MSGIKELIRKTPLIHVYRKYIMNRDRAKNERLNNKYKNCIDPLLNPDILEAKIERLRNVKDEANRTYYVISLANDKVGIIGFIDNILPHIAYALANGYVPVIDMENYPSIYQIDKENVWETYFEQPCNKGLEAIKDECVIHAPNSFWYRWEPKSCPLMTEQEIRMWGRIYAEYIRYNSETMTYVNQEKESIISTPEKILGALYRGTDYTKGQAIGHPIQPSMKAFAEKVEEMMLKHGYEYIYLASEEKAIVDYMNERFPGKVLINKRVFYDEATNVDYSNYNNDHIGLSGAVFERENNKYLIGIEYISSMNLAASCDSFVAGACGGTTGVLMMNNLKFREKYIFNLGKYGFDPLPEE